MNFADVLTWAPSKIAKMYALAVSLLSLATIAGTLAHKSNLQLLINLCQTYGWDDGEHRLTTAQSWLSAHATPVGVVALVVFCIGAYGVFTSEDREARAPITVWLGICLATLCWGERLFFVLTPVAFIVAFLAVRHNVETLGRHEPDETAEGLVGLIFAPFGVVVLAVQLLNGAAPSDD